MPAAIPLAIALGTAGGSIGAAALASKGSKEGANITSAAQLKAAQIQTDAQNHAADLQAKSAADTLGFTKQQAETDYRNQELARKGNYDIDAARQARLSSFGQMLGLPARETPAYVPSVDPNYLGAPSAAAALSTQGAPATTVPNGDYQSWFQSLTGGKPLDQQGLLALAPQLQAAGVKITPPSAAGVVSKIGLPDGSWVRVLNGDTNVASPTVWVPQPGTGGASMAAPAVSQPRPVGTAAPYVPLPTGNLQIPTSIAAMLR